MAGSNSLLIRDRSADAKASRSGAASTDYQFPTIWHSLGIEHPGELIADVAQPLAA